MKKRPKPIKQRKVPMARQTVGAVKQRGQLITYRRKKP